MYDVRSNTDVTLYLEQSKIYVDIFSKMERLPQLLKYYHNCLKVSLGQEWRRTIELAQDENVTYWLHMYYDKLLSSWNEQVYILFQIKILLLLSSNIFHICLY